MSFSFGGVNIEHEVITGASIAGGMIALEKLGSKISEFIGKVVPAEWVDVATPIVTGLFLVWLGYKYGGKYTNYIVLAGEGAIGVGIYQAVKGKF